MTGSEDLADGIVEAVGGPGNIRSVGHCTTRLRLGLVDRARADRDSVRALPGIMSTVERGGQFQVVVGHQVAEVDARVRALVAEANQGRAPDEAPPPGSLVDRAFALFMGTFQPLLWALVGASMVRTMLSVAVRLDWIDPSSGTFAVWAGAGGAVFVLLPVFVGITASTTLGANPYVGGAIGAALVAGTLAEFGEPGTRTAFLGIPLSLADYTSSVFPAMLAAVGLAVLEGWLRRVLPRDLHLVAVPALCLAVLVPATVLLFGPIGTFVGRAIAEAVTTLNEFSPVLTGALYAAGFMFMVMLGLHWATLPAILAGLAADGADPLPAYMGAANFAVFGIALGVAVRTRDVSLRQLGTSGVVTGLLAGISEPTVYGILLRFRRTLPIMVAAAALGGAILGLGRVESTAFAFSNLFTIPAMTPTGAYVLGIGVAFTVAAVSVVVLGYEDRRAPVAGELGEGSAQKPAEGAVLAQAPAVEAVPGVPPAAEVLPGVLPGEVAVAAGRGTPAAAAGDRLVEVEATAATAADLTAVTILAPFAGVVVPLAEVADPVFAKGLLGPGVAIRPSGGALVRSPAEGRITSVARAKHAIGLTTPSGVDMVIHIGLDTVHLAGRHFEVLVRTGDPVVAGQPIAYADFPALIAEGFDPTTPVVVTSARGLRAPEVVARTVVEAGQPLLRAVPAPAREPGA